MADLKKLMLDEIRKNSHIQSSYIDETEELIDTGLEKNEDNLNAVALAYLDEKGYRRIAENVDITKKKILELSEGYDTLIVKKRNHFDSEADAKCVDSIKLEKDRPRKGRLGEEEFESFEETLNRYARKGYEIHKIFPEPKGTKIILVFRKDLVQ